MNKQIIHVPLDLIKIGSQHIHLRDVQDDQIQHFMDILNCNCIEINAQLETTDYSSVERKWLSNAKASLRVKNRQRSLLMARLVEVKKKEKSSRTAVTVINEVGRRQKYAEQFTKSAKNLLAPMLYLAIAQEAGRICDLEEAINE